MTKKFKTHQAILTKRYIFKFKNKKDDDAKYIISFILTKKMFYEENKIKQILKCPKCESQLVDAYLLPCCGESVCSKCLPSKSAQTCSLCTHTLDVNNNYQPNKVLNRLIDLEPTDVYRGEPIDMLKQKTVTMSSEIDDLKLTDDSLVSTRIVEHCRRIRDEVLNRTKLTLDAIDVKSASILAEIDSYEKSCNESYRKGKSSFGESLKGLENEFAEYRRRFKKLLNEPHSVPYSLSSIVDEANQLKLRIEAAKLALQRLMFTQKMMEYHECPRSAIGCILVFKKLCPTYADLTSLRIKDDLLNIPDLLFTYFQIGFLNNGHLVLSVSDGDIFK